MSKTDKYIPAFGHDMLTPLYDVAMKWLMPEDRFKRHLIRQAAIERGQRVLDLGCGTGTLTILIKQLHPESEVVGLDGDPNVLVIARAKAKKAGIDIAFDEAMAFQLPYPDGSFDRVLCSLVLHHLTTENKRRALKEVYRILRLGGELHVADLGKPSNFPAYLISLIIRLFEDVMDNIKGLLPEMFARAGFSQVEETARYMTLVGTLALYKAQKPG
jgi:ubiquinone/menaquinone biosynthesis C-methylase UbiE